MFSSFPERGHPINQPSRSLFSRRGHTTLTFLFSRTLRINHPSNQPSDVLSLFPEGTNHPTNRLASLFPWGGVVCSFMDGRCSSLSVRWCAPSHPLSKVVCSSSDGRSCGSLFSRWVVCPLCPLVFLCGRVACVALGGVCSFPEGWLVVLFVGECFYLSLLLLPMDGR